MDSKDIKIVISLISSALSIPCSFPEISKEDVSNIECVAAKQSIIPIVTIGMKNAGFSNVLTESMIKRESKDIFDYTQRVSSLKEISDVFEKENIPYIPLKGSVLRDLYPQPWMRTCSDIDVLIHEDDLNKAIDVLNSQSSFKYYDRKHHDAHFVNDRVHLELHYSLLSRIDTLDSVLKDPWKYSVQLDGTNQFAFTPEFQVFYITSHIAKHFFDRGGVGIRPLLDLLVLRLNTEFNEKIVKSLCEDAGVLGFYSTCNKLLNVWFYGDSHNDVSKLLEDVVFSGGVFGSEQTRIVSNKRKDSGSHYVISRLFKSGEELKRYYPRCGRYPILIPFYQVVRWCHLIFKKKPQEYLSEFEQASLVDSKEIEKYDKLMKGMGL